MESIAPRRLTALAFLRRLYWKRLRRYDSEICGTTNARLATVLRYGCGRPVGVVWHAPDDLWGRVVGGEGGGLLCLPCFDRACQEAGEPLRWEASAL